MYTAHNVIKTRNNVAHFSNRASLHFRYATILSRNRCHAFPPIRTPYLRQRREENYFIVGL